MLRFKFVGENDFKKPILGEFGKNQDLVQIR